MTQRKPRVFLSHSGVFGVTKDVLDALESALAEDFEPLVDRTHIVGGADFQKAIDKFVEVCDAAVFIINKRALEPEHPWVRDEANQLRQKLIDQFFQGVPVFIEGVLPGQLGAGWQSTGLGSRNGVVETKPEVVAEKVVAMLSQTRDLLNAEPIFQQIEIELATISSDQALRDAAQVLGGGWATGRLRLQIARRLRNAKAEQIIAFAKRLAVRAPAVAQAVLNLALPFTWVELDAARELGTAVRTGRPAGLRAADSGTPKIYLRCGWVDYPPWKVEAIGPPIDDGGVEGLEAEAQEKLGWANGELEEDGPPAAGSSSGVVFAVDYPKLDEHTLSLLETLASWRNVGVVLLARGMSWAEVPAELRPRITLLVPELDERVEEESLELHREVFRELPALHDIHITITTEAP